MADPTLPAGNAPLTSLGCHPLERCIEAATMGQAFQARHVGTGAIVTVKTHVLGYGAPEAARSNRLAGWTTSSPN